MFLKHLLLVIILFSSTRHSVEEQNALYIDAHFHIWELDRFNYPFPTKEMSIYRNYGPDELWKEMQKTPVKNAVFVQIMNDGIEEAQWISDLADKHRFIKGIVAGIDFQKDNVEQTIETLMVKIPKFVGVRHILGYAPPGWLNDPQLKSGLAILEKHNLTYDLVIKTPNIPDVLNLARSFPKLKMVIDHIAKPNIKEGGTPGWMAGMKELAECPNIYCKLSGMVTEADLENWSVDDLRPYVDYVLEHFGVDRCMFGTDWPVCTMANASYATVFGTLNELLHNVSSENRRKIFGENAKMFYKLKDLDY